MNIELFDKILLKTDETAYVVEIYENGEAYEADIDRTGGRTSTETVRPHEILEKL